MKKGVNSVMQALEGEVELSHHHKKLSPFKHNLLSQEKGIDQLQTILNTWQGNSILQVWLNFGDVKTLFVPNLNIKDIIVIDDGQRQETIKRQTKIIDIWLSICIS